MSTPEYLLSVRLAQLRERIELACRRSGRAPGSVALLPVSKTFPADVLAQALDLGLHRLGENKLQEIRDKQAQLAGRGVQWVMIGHLQTNKAKDAARLAAEVQSLDRLSLAQELDRRLRLEQRSLDVLIQVKTSPEESKFGLPPEDLPAFMQALRSLDTLRVRGLMTMAVNSPDPQAVRACFRLLRQWRDRLQELGHEQVQRLSMGMSGDFELAIQEGSTEVRVGSALFGARDYA
ncbi:YggS family pyridoxal phosphate-dependent enzyme [Alcaligenes sp. WGS1538]|uniref:YggS family pyridoxal phosphate-dependent enzyme n=1 Tax=Alcaligenes sp. WGS1538 TaxID=3366811 RepID=UPI00372D1DD4